MPKETQPKPTDEALHHTAEFFQPGQFGFETVEPNRHWRKEAGGPVIDFVALDWFDRELLPGLVKLQADVWGMEPIDVVPHNTLAIAGATGGGVIGAYDPGGELIGGALWFGSNTPWAVSHMVGVVKKHRYLRGLGYNLKLLQACLVAQDGYQGMSWTYDALRGANARLNIEKLGAVVKTFKINVYGKSLRSKEYGSADNEKPTDRFVARWDLSNPEVQTRVLQYYQGTYEPLHPQECNAIPLVMANRIDETGYQYEVEYPEGTTQLKVEIPPDISVVNTNHKLGRAWILRSRAIFSQLLTTHHGRDQITEGNYVVTGFATGKVGPKQQRKSCYILSRKTRV